MTICAWMRQSQPHTLNNSFFGPLLSCTFSTATWVFLLSLNLIDFGDTLCFPVTFTLFCNPWELFSVRHRLNFINKRHLTVTKIGSMSAWQFQRRDRLHHIDFNHAACQRRCNSLYRVANFIDHVTLSYLWKKNEVQRYSSASLFNHINILDTRCCFAQDGKENPPPPHLRFVSIDIRTLL